MAITAAAHRLCRIIFAMLRHHSDFDINKLGVERGHPVTSLGLEPSKLYGALLAALKHWAYRPRMGEW